MIVTCGTKHARCAGGSRARWAITRREARSRANPVLNDWAAFQARFHPVSLAAQDTGRGGRHLAQPILGPLHRSRMQKCRSTFLTSSARRIALRQNCRAARIITGSILSQPARPVMMSNSESPIHEPTRGGGQSRVHITFDVEIGGAVKKKELPFVEIGR